MPIDIQAKVISCAALVLYYLRQALKEKHYVQATHLSDPCRYYQENPTW